MNSDHQVIVVGGSAVVYHAMVEKLVKKFDTGVGKSPVEIIGMVMDYASRLELMHTAIGLATEGAEAADVIKQHAIYGKPFDRAALVKELGDIRFWIQDAQNKFHISDEEILQGNADKLSERYKKLSYTDEQAIARVDKKYVVYATSIHMASGLVHSRWEHSYEAEQEAQRIGGIYAELGA